MLINLIILIHTLEKMLPGEEKWLNLPLADSYEYEVMEEKNAYTTQEYRKIFLEEGFSIEHLEVKHEMALFQKEEDLKNWIHKELAPHIDPVSDALFTESHFEKMKETGWMISENGQIFFPRKKLLVLIKKEENKN